MSGSQNANRAEYPLSVVVASTSSVQEVDAFLTRVLPQAKDTGAEVIVADATEDQYLEEIRAKHPEAIILSFPRGSTLPLLWGAGVLHARMAV